jgi:hypothetical protein
VAAAEDMSQGSSFTNAYIYGDLAIDKGVTQIKDDIQRIGF